MDARGIAQYARYVFELTPLYVLYGNECVENKRVLFLCDDEPKTKKKKMNREERKQKRKTKLKQLKR